LTGKNTDQVNKELTGSHQTNSKPQRILLVLTEFPPSIGGMQAHALYLSRYLADAGYHLVVVTYRPSSTEDRDIARDFDNQFSFPVHRVLSRLVFWYNVEVLGQIAGQFKPDLIYCSTVFYGFLRNTTNVPIVCRSAGNDVLRPWIAYPFPLASRLLATPHLDNWLYNTFKKMEYPELVEIFFQKKRHALVSQSARQMDLVIANSRFTANLLHEVGVAENRVKIAVGGVDAKRFAPPHQRDGLSLRRALGIRDEAYVMTTVCRLVAKKGIDFLLHTFRTAHDLMPDSHLLIVGDGRYSKRYQRLAHELGVSAWVTFTGSVSHLDIHRYYWLTDLFVLASRIQVDPTTGIRDAETMGRVLCEANAAGVPVVAARSGGIPSVIECGQNGLLFEPDDEQSFLTQIQRVRREPELRQKLIQTGLLMAKQKFDWSILLKAHETFFIDIVTTKPHVISRPEAKKSLGGSI
jgi:glycosyltransferase involved in cell wall biosynthesis